MRVSNSFWRRSLVLLVVTAMLAAMPVSAFAASATVTASAPAAKAAAAATTAKSQLGERYVFGGESPKTGFDSSGLAQWAYGQQGVSISRRVIQQYGQGTKVTQSELLPGDLVFFDFDKNGSADKVGVYLGSSQFVISVDPGGVVERNFSWAFYKTHYASARRIVATQIAPPEAPAPTPAPPTAPPIKPAPAPSQAFGDKVVARARTYMGIPYKFGAEGPNYYDCSGFTQKVFRDLGVRLPRTAAQQSRVGRFIAKKDLQPGDLVFFQNTYTKSSVDHVGIYIGGGKFINAWPRAGVTISDMTRPYFVSHYWGAKRVQP